MCKHIFLKKKSCKACKRERLFFMQAHWSKDAQKHRDAGLRLFPSGHLQKLLFSTEDATEAVVKAHVMASMATRTVRCHCVHWRWMAVAQPTGSKESNWAISRDCILQRHHWKNQWCTEASQKTSSLLILENRRLKPINSEPRKLAWQLQKMWARMLCRCPWGKWLSSRKTKKGWELR